MAWVKSEYAGEFAVLSTWLVGVAPWSATLFGRRGFRVVQIRFLPFRLQYIFGPQLPQEQPILPTWAIADLQQSPELTLGGQLAFGALAVYLLPLGLSLYYYFEEERITELLPVDPVRLFGALLGIVGVLTISASAMYIKQSPGTTLPIGAVLALVFSYLLLTIDRT